jgi:hypothetical protein
LHPQDWREWRIDHANAPTTLDAYYMPAAGLVVKEQTWASELNLGGLLLTGIPVMEANPAEVALGSAEFQASLGLAALKRLDFVVDGKQGLAYIRVKRSPPPPFEHNRLGAVFVPRDPRAQDLVASVVDGTPAAKAGIRNGDVLLKLNDLDVTKWRTDPAILPLSRFWARPAGTRLNLTLRRGEETLKITVALRQILAPVAEPPTSAALTAGDTARSFLDNPFLISEQWRPERYERDRGQKTVWPPGADSGKPNESR